jgi:hypothetical protein
MSRSARSNRRSFLSALSFFGKEIEQFSVTRRTSQPLKLDHGLFMLEDRIAPVINLSVGNLTLSEGDSGTRTATFIVTRSGDLNLGFDVSYSTADGSEANGAKAGVDYKLTSGTLKFAANDLSKTVDVIVYANNIFQNDRSFTLTLSNPVLAPGSIPVSFPNPVAIPSGTAPSDIAVGDFNNDGQMDMVVTQATSNTVGTMLWKNGAFANASNFSAVGKNPVSVCVGDFNNDKNQDVAVANADDGTVSILTGKGTGFFNTAITYAVGQSPTKIVSEDVDGDGKTDFLVLCSNDTSIYYFKNTGSSFTVQSIAGASVNVKKDLVVADINNDGLRDLIIAGENRVIVYKKNSQGGFNTPLTISISGRQNSLACQDFDKDGINDLAVLGDDKLTLFKSTAGFLNFQSTIAIDNGAVDIVATDLNKDGYYDLVFTDSHTYLTEELEVMLGTSNFSFLEATRLATQSAGALVAYDFNMDGLIDISIANKKSDTVTFYTGNSNILLNGVQVYKASSMNQISPSNNIASLATVDVNNDGKQDVVATGQNSRGLSIFTGTGNSSPALTKPPVYQFDVQGGGEKNTIVTSDFNADGYQDLAVGTGDVGKINIFLNAGDGTYSSATIINATFTVRTMATGDFNGDRKVDIAILDGSDLIIYFGNGTGLFPSFKNFGKHQGTSEAAYLLTADLNKDTYTDLMVVQKADFSSSITTSGFITTYLNSINGLGIPIGSSFDTRLSQYGCSVGDANLDGIPDLIYSTSNSLIAALGSGSGSFTRQIILQDGLPNSTEVSNIFALSLDTDNIPEYIISRDRNLIVLQFDASKTLNLVYSANLPDYPSRVKPLAISDINNDGKLDVIFSGRSGAGGFAVFLNNTKTTGFFDLTNGTATIKDDDSPATIVMSSGDQQTALVGNSFGNPVAVFVKNASGNPVQNVNVSYTMAKGANNAIGSFSGVSTVITDAQGIAVSSQIKTGNIPGSFKITASVLSGSQTLSTDFTLWQKLAMTYTIDEGSFLEGDSGLKQINIAVSRSGNIDYPGTIDYLTVSDTASDVSDFNSVSGKLQFASGERTKSVAINLIGNLVLQPDRSFKLNLKNPSADSSIPWIFTLPQYPATISIADDDSPSSATIQSGDNQSARSLTPFTQPLTVKVLNSAGNPVENVPVRFNIVNGSGGSTGTFSGSDTTYSNTSGVAVANTLTAGTLPGSFKVLAVAEGGSLAPQVTFNLNVTAAISYTVDNMTIQEGDIGNKQMSFVIRRTGTTSLPSSVDYITSSDTAIEGSDFIGASGKVLFAANELTKTLTVQVVGNTVLQTDRIFNLKLSNPGTSSSQPIEFILPSQPAVGTIIEDDQPMNLYIVAGNTQLCDVNTLYSSALSLLVKNAAGNPVSGVPISFNINSSLAGQSPNFVSPPQVITGKDGIATSPGLNAGSSPGTFTVVASASPNKKVIYNLTQQGHVSYLVNDSQVLEGDNGNSIIVFTITRSGSTDLQSSVSVQTLDGTAKSGVDFVYSQSTLNFASGQTSLSFSVSVIGNTVLQGNRTFSVSLNNPVANPSQYFQSDLPTGNAVGQILDDDTPSTVLILSGNNQVAPIRSKFAQPLSVQIKNKAGNPVSGVAVPYNFVPGGISSIAKFQSDGPVVTDKNGVANSSVINTLSTQGNINVGLGIVGLDPTQLPIFKLNIGPPQITNLIVQQGASERSFIRFVNVLVSDSVTAQTLFSSLTSKTPRVRLTNTGLDGRLKTAVSLKNLVKLNGNTLQLDFGSKGIGSNASSSRPDGSYLLEFDLDTNGSFEYAYRFHRLLGDLNGDKVVDANDTSIVNANLNKSGMNIPGDTNGDGKVNSSDLSYVKKAQKRKISV